MIDPNRGFLKLHEDNSRRGSSFHHPPPLEGCGLYNGTRINVGCGKCLNLRVKAERDEGSLRIGGLAVAANCHLIVLIFGFFFLLAGAVLTALAYKPPSPNARSDIEDNSQSRQEGKIAGPIFVIIGSTMVFLGLGLTMVGCKLNQEAKRQLNHFTLQTPPLRTPDTPEYFSAFANLQDNPYQSRCLSAESARRDSLFGSAYFGDRRKTLPTIAQAVPVGFFMDGKLSGFVENGNHPDVQNQEIQQNEELHARNVETGLNNADEYNRSSQIRASLALRPSLPIPIIASPNFMSRNRLIAPLDPSCLVRTRSDEPFGSIASLSGTGDIACFPAPPTSFAPCVEEETDKSYTSPRDNRGLPPIKVNESANPLNQKATNENNTIHCKDIQIFGEEDTEYQRLNNNQQLDDCKNDNHVV